MTHTGAKSRHDIALLLTTFERPGNLRRALLSIALQQNVPGRLELVVTDDGSRDETPQIVERFARSVDFPVRFTTHRHDGFQVARCRNEGVAATEAPYLLFVDGDCVLPRNHVAIHMKRRRAGTVMVGDCVRLDRETSAAFTEEVIARDRGWPRVPRGERRRLRAQARRAWFYNLLRHPTKPKLIGNNVGMWRTDFECINGYDENYVGWGCEDDDLGKRLLRAGLKIHSILPWTHTFHLWHPSEPTNPTKWRDGINVSYLNRRIQLTRCRNGLRKIGNEDLRIRIVGRASQPEKVEQLLPERHMAGAARPEVEFLFLPGTGDFTGEAECNVLVLLDNVSIPPRVACRANVVLADHPQRSVPETCRFGLSQLDEALRNVA